MPKIRLDQQGKPDSVVTSLIKNLEVETEDLKDGAVTKDKIAPQAITSLHIENQAVTVEKIRINNDLSFNFNQLKEVRIENVNSLPSPGFQGRIVFLQSDKFLYYDNGNEWIRILNNVVPSKKKEVFIISDFNQKRYVVSQEILSKSEEVILNGLRLVPFKDYKIENKKEIVFLDDENDLNEGDILVVLYYEKGNSLYFRNELERNIFILRENQHSVILPYEILEDSEKISLNGVTLIKNIDYTYEGREINLNIEHEILEGMILQVTYLVK